MTDWMEDMTVYGVQDEVVLLKKEVIRLRTELSKCREDMRIETEWGNECNNRVERIKKENAHLQSELDKCREALEFYADPAGWQEDKVPWGDTWVDLPNTNYVQYDGGATARKALGEQP